MVSEYYYEPPSLDSACYKGLTVRSLPWVSMAEGASVMLM